MYTCMHAYMGVCVSMFACKNVCVWGVCVYACMGGCTWCMYVCTCMGMCVYAWLCVVEGCEGKWTDSGPVKIGSVSLTPKLEVQTGPRR